MVEKRDSFSSTMARDIAVFLVLSVLSSATVQTTINENLDQQLQALNALNTRNELGLLDLKGGSLDGFEFSRGFLYGLNTLERRGNASASNESYILPLGLRQLRLAFALVRTQDGLETSATFNLPENRLRFGFTVLREPECRPRIDELAFTDLGLVQIETSEPLEETTRGTLQQAVLPYLNSKLDEKKNGILVNLQAVCWDID